LPLASGDPLKITDPKHGEKHTHTHTRDFFGREKNRTPDILRDPGGDLGRNSLCHVLFSAN